ncbi:MAG: DUF4491 family protein, partial [Synergistaceae bacterium]|nr:DUF4491 family protein [Synergistaceae bacterium]
MNWAGVVIGAAAFIIIGAFHPVVIKGEYYFGHKIWPLFLIAGLICGALSLLIEEDIISGILGILACVLLWCIKELKEQTERVKKGWFPKNPKR